MIKPSVKLIINADDYGYFSCVSKGILKAAENGGITATGVLANSPDVSTQLKRLDDYENLDVGIHLNLTFNAPITSLMQQKLAPWQGCFPDVKTMCWLILSRKLTLQDIQTEWEAQIEMCRQKHRVFLNSHEHIHMLPVLFPLTLKLAKKYNIQHVRFSRADWRHSRGVSALSRNTLMQAMQIMNHYRCKANTPVFLGLGKSGKLDLAYLDKILSNLQPGKSYELMCHPGYFDDYEITASRLRAYHDWEAELALLQSQELADLLKRHSIRLIRYQEIV